jgi:hypothetical protein
VRSLRSKHFTAEISALLFDVAISKEIVCIPRRESLLKSRDFFNVWRGRERRGFISPNFDRGVHRFLELALDLEYNSISIVVS